MTSTGASPETADRATYPRDRNFAAAPLSADFESPTASLPPGSRVVPTKRPPSATSQRDSRWRRRRRDATPRSLAAAVCNTHTDMLNNKNLSDLCRRELDTRGWRKKKKVCAAGSGGDRYLLVEWNWKVAGRYGLTKRISVDRRMAWEWARGLERVNGTWKTAAQGLTDWKVFLFDGRTFFCFFKSFVASFLHSRSLGCIVLREIGANILFFVQNIDIGSRNFRRHLSGVNKHCFGYYFGKLLQEFTLLLYFLSYIYILFYNICLFIYFYIFITILIRIPISLLLQCEHISYNNNLKYFVFQIHADSSSRINMDFHKIVRN